MPIDYKLYPSNWKSEIRPAILERAGNCCEFCGVQNYTQHPETGSKVVLTIAHLNHDIHDNDGLEPGGVREGLPPLPFEQSNLASLCQCCHNRLDGHKRAQSRIRHRRKRLERAGQRRLFV